MSIFIRILKTTFYLLLFATALIYFLVETSVGANFSIKTLALFLPGKLQIATVQGNLAGAIHFQKMNYSDDNTQIFIDSLNWKLRPWQLLQQKLVFDSIEASGVRANFLSTQGKNAGSASPTSFTFLNNLQITHLHVKDFLLLKNRKKLYQFDQLLVNKVNEQNILSLHSQDGQIDGQFSYSVLPDFALHMKLIGDTKVGNYPVHGSAEADYMKNQLRIKIFRVKVAESQLIMSGLLDHDWHLTWKLNVPKLAMFYSDLSGTLISSGEVKGAKDKPYLTAQVFANDLIYNDIKIKKMDSQISSQWQSPDYSTGTLLLSATELILPSGYRIPAVKTELNARLQPMQLAQFKNPVLALHATLQNAKLIIPELKLSLESIHATADYRENQPVSITGNFVSGKGKAEVSGQIEVHQPGMPLAFKLAGQDLTVSDLSEYRIIASPTLAFSLREGISNFEGQIDIPKAEIKPKDFSSVTTLPNEVVIVDREKKPTTKMPTKVALNVKLRLGNKVQIHYNNLAAKLAGEVTITQIPGSLPIGSGELYTIDGEYKAYGKLLMIKQGRLIYTGNPITNPGLDIRATQQFQTLAYENSESKFNDTSALDAVYTGTSNSLTVGILVKGTLNHPNITLYSDPAGLSQSDILSYLVFGYPRSKIKDANKLGMLNSLASGLYPEKTNTKGITNKIQTMLGLNEMDIGSKEFFDPNTSSTGSTTAVTLGKKIGKNLSLRYSIGVFDSLSVFNLKYQINKRLSIQSQTSTLDTGADIMYEFEKD